MSQIKNFFWLLLGVLMLTSCAKPQQKPNIIFLLTDDQRFDAVGYAGNQHIQTPNIDALANKGLMFDNAYVTTSICCASRASILSGQYASRHGIHAFQTDFSPEAMQQTYPLLLKNQAGYKIGFIGKYGIGLKGHPGELFDYWGCEQVYQPHYENFDSNGVYHHYTDLVHERIDTFLNRFAGEEPFCLSVSFKAPHTEDNDPRQFIYHPRYKQLYADSVFEKPSTAGDEYWMQYSSEFRKDNVARTRWEWRFATDSMYQESVRGYYRLIKGIDDVVGDMVQRLKELGLDKNTIIVFMGDNGFFLGEHGMAGKWYAYEESVRVPLFIYNPFLSEKKRGKHINDIALNIDIAPTILSYAGVGVPDSMQGVHLQNLADNDGTSERTSFFYEHRLPNPKIPKSEALVSRDFKYIEYYQLPDSNMEYYDLLADPAEVNNLVYSGTASEKINRAKALLDSFKVAVK